MPLICIKSLPFDDAQDMPAMIKGVTEDFARSTDVPIEHITVTWEFIPSRQYAVAGLMPQNQPQGGSHPILVDLHAPSGHSQKNIEAMMESIAFSISNRSGVSFSNIFIQYHKIQAGHIFDGGVVKYWK